MVNVDKESIYTNLFLSPEEVKNSCKATLKSVRCDGLSTKTHLSPTHIFPPRPFDMQSIKEMLSVLISLFFNKSTMWLYGLLIET